MQVLQRIVIGLVVFTVMVLGVARGNGVNEPGDRERVDQCPVEIGETSPLFPSQCLSHWP
jgi:hypothetical protein